MLFSPDTPQGFQYRDDFISVAEEAALLENIGRIEFANFEMRGDREAASGILRGDVRPRGGIRRTERGTTDSRLPASADDTRCDVGGH